MKLKLDYVTFSVIIFITLFILRLGWFYTALPDVKLIAEQGKVSLNTTYIDDNEYMYLEGEWFVESSNVEKYIDSNERLVLEDNVVTTSMIVNMDDKVSKQMTIHIPSSEYRTHVYIDGELLNSKYERQGTTYQSYKVDYTPQSEQFTIAIEVEGDGQRIVLPISNRYIAIGSSDAVTIRNELGTAFAVSVIAIFILVILLSAIFYVFINQSKLVLYLVFILLFPTLGELYTIALPYIEWIKIPYNYEAKLYNIVYFISQFVLILMLKELSGRHKIPNINLVILLYVLTFLVLLLLPIEYLDMASIYLILFYVMWIVYFFSHLLRFYIISRYEMYSLLYIGISVISGLVWGIIKNNIHYSIPFYPYDYIGLILGFAGFWFNRFMQNAKAIKLSDLKKEQFLQQVSEQLSIPLNKLELDLDEQYSNEVDPELKDKIHKMTTTVKGMSFVLNNWLDYSRLKDKTLEAQKQPVDVIAAVNYVSELMKETLKMPELKIKIRKAKQLPHILADSKLLSQVLYNLIYLQLEKQNHHALYIECSHVMHYVIIKIEDATKIGQNGYIWSTETDFPITIQICDAIIAEQGGNLEVKDNGFSIRLPKQAGDVEDIDKTLDNHFDNDIVELQNQTPNVSGRKVLAYSTEINTLSTLQSVVVGSGNNLTQATRYYEFIEYYNKQTWDLIILESTLNDSSSLAILDMIRSRFNLIDLPILIVLVPTSTNFISTYFQKGMNDYITRPIHAIELKYKIQTLLQSKYLVEQRLQLEASLLQNQIEPHFLFNTLNSIASLSKIDVDKMVMLLEQFGHYLSRGFKKRLLKQLIDLKDELDIVKSYLYIEELRYEPFLKVEWDVEELYDVKIPPYAIQTIVENAIKHGIRKKRHGGTIRISVKKRRHHIEIKVIDDGVGMSADKIKSLFNNDIENGIGIYNTHVRLLNSFGEGLHVESIEEQGTTISFNIPINIKNKLT